MTPPERPARRFPEATRHPEGTCEVCDERRSRQWQYMEVEHR